MDAGIITTAIGVVGGLFTVAATFWLTKKQERDAAWQKEKLGYYKAFIESLSDVLESTATPERFIIFDKNINNLLLFAPQSVLKAIKSFREFVHTNDSRLKKKEHDRLLAQFLIEMRRDIGVYPNDDPASFDVELYGYFADEKNP